MHSIMEAGLQKSRKVGAGVGGALGMPVQTLGPGGLRQHMVRGGLSFLPQPLSHAHLLIGTAARVATPLFKEWKPSWATGDIAFADGKPVVGEWTKEVE